MARLGRVMLSGIVGAALGMLFAPKAGKELRRMLTGARRPALPPVIKRPSAPPPHMEPVHDLMEEPAGGLESRIGVTRQQVEAELAEAVAFPPPEEAVMEAPVETIEAEEAPAATTTLVAPVMPETTGGEVAEEETTTEEIEPAAGPVAEEELAATEAVVEEEIEEEATAAEAASETAVAEMTVEEPEAAPQPAPSGFDREEMKQRIEATRNRLKAKAFDSMVGGETLMEGEGGTIADAAPETGIDDDTSEKIDLLLEEED